MFNDVEFLSTPQTLGPRFSLNNVKSITSTRRVSIVL